METILGSPMCEHCNMERAILYCKTHSARVCHQCDWALHSLTMDSLDHSRFLLCNNCVSQTAVVQSPDQGLWLCQTCVSSNANLTSRFLFCNVSNSNSGYSFPNDLDLDSSSSSLSSSLIDLHLGFPFVSLPPNNGDSSSSSGFFQNFDNHTKNSEQHVQMLQPQYLDIPKDSSCSGFNGYDTKDIENDLMNIFDGDKAVLDPREYSPGEELFLTEQLVDEITIHNAETTTEIFSSSSPGRSWVTHKDYNVEALANARFEDYNKNQMIGSKPKEETTNNVGMFPNALVQLDSGPSQLILTDEMLPWEDQTLESHVFCPQARLEAVKRYFAKKKKRKFGKQIRYESRKSTADTKRRMKGRFTKAGAEYDYDPRANNTNKERNKIMT